MPAPSKKYIVLKAHWVAKLKEDYKLEDIQEKLLSAMLIDNQILDLLEKGEIEPRDFFKKEAGLWKVISKRDQYDLIEETLGRMVLDQLDLSGLGDVDDVRVVTNIDAEIPPSHVATMRKKLDEMKEEKSPVETRKPKI